MLIARLRKYRLSILVILTIIYLSFFKPPTDLRMAKIPNIDKIVHIIMYMGLSGMLWLEFLWGHRKERAPMWHAWIGAFLCPVLFSGIVEILQEYCTTYRGGSWLDLLANTVGATIAGLLFYYVVRPYIETKFKTK